MIELSVQGRLFGKMRFEKRLEGKVNLEKYLGERGHPR